MRYQVQMLTKSNKWRKVTETTNEELAYWMVSSRQRQGAQARVVEFSK